MQQDFSDKYIINPTEIERRLLHINLHKSSDPYGLPSWLLRDLAPSLSQPLALFNASLRKGYLPPIWKSVLIAILHMWMTALDSQCFCGLSKSF